MRKNIQMHSLATLCLLFVISCADSNANAAHKAEASETGKSEAASSGHGVEKSLGSLTVAGRDFEVLLLGELVSGREGAIEVEPRGGVGEGTPALYIWLEDAAGTQLSAPARGSRAGDRLHFHVTPRAGGEAPNRVVLRVRGDGVDERGDLLLDGGV